MEREAHKLVKKGDIGGKKDKRSQSLLNIQILCHKTFSDLSVIEKLKVLSGKSIILIWRSSKK